MNETPLPSRVAALRFDTPPSSYSLRNRQVPRDDPSSAPDTPTLNLRNRAVPRDSPGPGERERDDREGDGRGSPRRQRALHIWGHAINHPLLAHPALQTTIDYAESTRDFMKKTSRRAVRWWNSTGWALRAAVFCWAFALLLWLLPAESTNFLGLSGAGSPAIPPTTIAKVREDVVLEYRAGNESKQFQLVESPAVLPKDAETLVFVAVSSNATATATATKDAEVVAAVEQEGPGQHVNVQPASIASAQQMEASTQTEDQPPLEIPQPPVVVVVEPPRPPPIADMTTLFSVDKGRSSPTFMLVPTGMVSRWLSSLVKWYTGNEIVIAKGGEPGTVLVSDKCWAMQGSSGKLLLTLPRPLNISSFLVSHPTPNPSAPRVIAFHAIRANSSAELLGSAHLDPRSSNETRVQANPAAAVNGVEVRVLANWGNAEYTCVKGIKVFAEVSQ